MMQMIQMMAQNSGSADPNPANRQKLFMTGDPYTDEQLDKWLVAKRSRDFTTADAIRDELRSMGVDPEEVRPKEETFKIDQSKWEQYGGTATGNAGWSGNGSTGSGGGGMG